MKKFFMGLCAACMLSASAIGYAGTVTFVNNYEQPVTFIVSTGTVYYPATGGTLEPGGRATLTVGEPFSANTYFMAFPPLNSITVSNCGHPTMPFNDVTIYASGMRNHSFSCYYEPHG